MSLFPSDFDYLSQAIEYLHRVNALPTRALIDADSRSILRSDQAFPSVSTYTGPQPNPDGSIDIWFGPKSPVGREGNWIQTVPGKGWFTLFRFYGPLEPFFDKTWKPGDIIKQD